MTPTPGLIKSAQSLMFFEFSISKRFGNFDALDDVSIRIETGEPFGALDAKVRKELRRWLRRLHDDLHVASVFVTYDQEEALEVADGVAIMNHGRIEQAGAPDEVYDGPANEFVYEFLGDVNLFHGRTEGSAAEYVRPYELEVTRIESVSSSTVTAAVRYIGAAGPTVRLELEREDSRTMIEAEISREHFRELGIGLGDRVGVTPRRVHVFGGAHTCRTAPIFSEQLLTRGGIMCWTVQTESRTCGTYFFRKTADIHCGGQERVTDR